ncbi:glutamine-hydrolyzing carbamoyl-phosphate synthase small subunit [Candidatus Poriferisodalis sp.]|uniref:glutamine-hydrolyzing carbamoyl-phosphate synthase small subunit n=1 Tax=Candidatus Poriferisodalis sp. TaxID=3101277 RepID=UPI003D0BE23F
MTPSAAKSPIPNDRSPTPGCLVLSDGTTFEGEMIGAPTEIASGEVVFNTVMTGYQEVITDPSYAGQIISFTYPHIGNYGTAAADAESRRPFCRGVVIRDLARRRSNWRSEGDLDSYLASHGIAGIAGVDTRRLTRHVRNYGAMPGAFGPTPNDASLGRLRAAASAEPGTSGVDLVAEVTTSEPYTVGDGPWRVVAYDLGIKRAITTNLARIATVEVVPAGTSAADVLAREPHGVFLSNGPGDPQMSGTVTTALADLLGTVPVFGICLGQQVLGLALGGRSYKLRFGHHGGNVPVRDEDSGRIEITSQNHNFAIESGSVPGVRETHFCLNDGALEGFACKDVPAFAVQYHPEASPGPHDSRHLFDRFADLMSSYWGTTPASGPRAPSANSGAR